MIQSVYQNGLRVETVSPIPGSLGSSVYTLIQLTFNSELDTASILNNVAVFEDIEGKYVDITTIKDNPDSFPKIEGTYTYKDRVITFTADKPFRNSVKYIVAVKNNGIRDIYGNTTVQEQSFHFVTESDDVEPKVKITSPVAGVVVSSLPDIEWTAVGTEAYYIEFSRQNTFETTAYVTVVKRDIASGKTPNTFSPLNDLPDGLYYLRVRALKGLWSDPIQIFVKKVTAGTTSQDDISDIIHQLDIDDQPLDLMEIYPKGNESNLPLSLGMCYFKFRGFVEYSELDIFGSMIEKTVLDEDSDIPEEVPGEWIHVYDPRDDVTYLIFQIEK